jgi:hypothetical protein
MVTYGVYLDPDSNKQLKIQKITGKYEYGMSKNNSKESLPSDVIIVLWLYLRKCDFRGTY